MSRFNKYRNHGQVGRGYTYKKCENEQVVREGLAYSPSDMARLTERGMPVNSINTGKAYFDGEENPSFDVTIDRSRHVDICDVWENHMVTRDKMRAVAKARKSKSKTE